MASKQNSRVILRSRPGKVNPPSLENFAVEPVEPPLVCEQGEILVKTLYLSVDPYMRSRMNEGGSVGYIAPFEIGKVLSGGGVGRVEESKSDKFSVGDIVECFGFPWQHYCVLPEDHQSLRKVESEIVCENPSLALGLCGLTALTSLIALQERGHIVPGQNQTVVVTGAAGACGSAAGQIAKIFGCGKLVGICGSEEKCQYIKELGFDSSINYKQVDNMAEELRKHCPQGIDVYFDNVGGEISNEIIRLMNKNSHVIICGQISTYNQDIPYPNPLPQDVQEIVTKQNITRERFLVLDFSPLIPAARAQLEVWVKEGKLKNRETVEEGLENVAKAFLSMMSGGNIGKQVVKVA
ncbi:predicted protein [Nematostella vectensis]|uniref:15-oxoprostaglandin 13-reductase n=1 Tax=Nematostella vectensis TaxID=45351 RepID=A7S3A7_NEMVE|nr:predicted protein [Nematostella vectensis]|eukprot:XP_001633881.1 predicted protein [Nematostella vectensis]